MKKEIKENWALIEQVEENVRKLTSDPYAGFNAGLLMFHGVVERTIGMECKYRKVKKDGFTSAYFDKLILIEFCPFSGKPLYEEV